MEAFLKRIKTGGSFYLVKNGVINTKVAPNFINDLGSISTYNGYPAFVKGWQGSGVVSAIPTSLATDYDLYIKGTIGSAIVHERMISGSGYCAIGFNLCGQTAYYRESFSIPMTYTGPTITLQDFTKQNIVSIDQVSQSGYGIVECSIETYTGYRVRSCYFWFGNDCSIYFKKK